MGGIVVVVGRLHGLIVILVVILILILLLLLWLLVHLVAVVISRLFGGVGKEMNKMVI